MTAKFTGDDDLRGAEFVGTDLRDARFTAVDLSGAGVNGVDVLPFVDAELNRLFPGRKDRFAQDPETLRTAWSTLEQAWAPILERAAADTVDVQIDGEWSFAQTLRHLLYAT